MKEHKGKRAGKPTLKIKMPSSAGATVSARTKPADATDREVPPASFQEGREGRGTGVSLNASVSAAQAVYPNLRARVRSEEVANMLERETGARFASLPPGPVSHLYPDLPRPAAREATRKLDHEPAERLDRHNPLESEGRTNPAITVPEAPPRTHLRSWSSCMLTLGFIFAEFVLVGCLLWILPDQNWMQAPAAVPVPERTQRCFFNFNASITSVAEASVSLGSMDGRSDDGDAILRSLQDLHSTLVEAGGLSLRLGQEYIDHTVPACESALTRLGSSSAVTQLSSNIAPLYSSSVSLLSKFEDAEAKLHGIREEVERKKGEAALRLEQAKRDLHQSSTSWRLMVPKLSGGEPLKWRTRQGIWESLSSKLSTMTEDFQSGIQGWTLLAQAADELQEAVEMETDQAISGRGKAFCDALAAATEADVGKEEVV